MKQKTLFVVTVVVVFVVAFAAGRYSRPSHWDAYSAYLSGFWMANFTDTLEVPENEVVYVHQVLDSAGIFRVFGAHQFDYHETEMPVGSLPHLATVVRDQDVRFICEDNLPNEKCRALMESQYCYVEKYQEGGKPVIRCT